MPAGAPSTPRSSASSPRCSRCGTLTSTKGTRSPGSRRRWPSCSGVEHAVACASGTAAVHVAIAGDRPGARRRGRHDVDHRHGRAEPDPLPGRHPGVRRRRPRHRQRDRRDDRGAPVRPDAGHHRHPPVRQPGRWTRSWRVAAGGRPGDRGRRPGVPRRHAAPAGRHGRRAAAASASSRASTSPPARAASSSPTTPPWPAACASSSTRRGRTASPIPTTSSSPSTTASPSCRAPWCSASWASSDANVKPRMAAPALTGARRPSTASRPTVAAPGDDHSYWRYCLRVDPDVVPGGPTALAAGAALLGHPVGAPLHPEAGVPVQGVRRPGDVRRQPLAVHAGPAGGRRLRRRAFPRHLRLPRLGPRAAVQRALPTSTSTSSPTSMREAVRRGRTRGRGVTAALGDTARVGVDRRRRHRTGTRRGRV